jgi:hypothetical protein
MIDVIDLCRERVRREAPDAEFVTIIDGVTWFAFSASYQDGDQEFSFQFWALDQADAERRVAVMRGNLKCDGQLFAVIEA